jgi:hypothetical protein
VPASTRTFREGSRLYLDNGTVKVGLETNWGGAIVEVVWHGMNFVNDYDTGREIQVALYDGDPYPGCDNCAGANGWDPVQGGDVHKHGSPLLAQTLEKDSIYIKTQPHHWIPENKGGSKDSPVPGDVFVEQWISFQPDTSTGIKVHYKITHFGKDQHTNAFQEFPAVYVNSGFDRFVYYGGEVPWTNAPVSFYAMPLHPKTSPPLYDPEDWGGFVNDDNIGLVVFVPGQYPYVSGFRALPEARKKFATNYFFPRVPTFLSATIVSLVRPYTPSIAPFPNATFFRPTGRRTRLRGTARPLDQSPLMAGPLMTRTSRKWKFW